MKTSCILHPTNKIGKPSKLFNDLRQEFNYDDSWTIWNAAVSPEFNAENGKFIKYDEGKEPVVDSVLTLLDWEKLIDNNISTDKITSVLNNNLSGDNIKFIQQVVDFNKKHSMHKAVITGFNTESNKAEIKIVLANSAEAVQSNNLENNLKILKASNRLLESFGIGYSFTESFMPYSENAIMDATSTSTLANGLLNVIKLSNNVKSIEQLPEEIGHFITVCSPNKGMLKRLRNYLLNNSSIVEKVLGEEYDNILNYYSLHNSPEEVPSLVTEEALGRLLISTINNNINKYGNIEASPTFFERLKTFLNSIKTIFKITTKSQNILISDLENSMSSLLYSNKLKQLNKEQAVARLKQFNNILANADKYSKSFTELFEAEDSVIQDIRKTIASNNARYAKVYHDNQDDIEELQDVKYKFAKQAAELFMHPQLRSLKDKESVEYKEFLNKIETNLKTKITDDDIDLRVIGHFGKYLNDLSSIFQQQFTTLQQIEQSNNIVTDSFSKAHELAEIRNFLLTQKEIIYKLLDFCDEINNTKSERTLSDNTYKCNAALLKWVKTLIEAHSRVEHEYDRITKNLTNEFYAEVLSTQDLEGLTGKSNIKDKTAAVNDILTRSIGDISAVSRFLSIGYDMGDSMVNMIHYTIRNQEEIIRQSVQDILKRHKEFTTEYADKTGDWKCNWIYAKDEDKNPTGYLITTEGVDIAKFQKAYKNKEKEIFQDESLNESAKRQKLRNWYEQNTQIKRIPLYKLNTETKEFEKIGDNYIKIPSADTVKNPEAVQWKTNDYDNLSEDQKKYLNDYLDFKAKLDSLLPNSYRIQNGYKLEGSYYKAVQRQLGSLGETILNNDNLTPKLIGNVLKDKFWKINKTNQESYGIGDIIFDSEDIDIEGDITEELNKVKRKNSKLRKLLYKEHKDGTVFKPSTFDHSEYKSVPIYFTKMLDDLSKLSTDANGSLQEYAISTINFHYMNQIADMIELTYERARHRTIVKKSLGNKIYERLENRNGDVLLDAVEINAEATNSLKALREMIDKHVYGQNEIISGIGNSNISINEMTKTLTSFTAFSMLGYNLFSGINNIVVGKYQTLIESFGGTISFKEWRQAEAEYHKLLPEFLKDFQSNKKTSKLYLLNEMFNATMEWKNNILDSDFYKSPVLKAMSNLGPSVLMNLGETNMKLVMMIALLKHEKMLDNNGNETSLYDSLDYVYKTNNNGDKITGKIKIKEGYTKPDKTKFTLTSKSLNNTSDLSKFCLRMNAIHHKMHGVYNSEDLPEAKRYWWGKLLLLFRNFIEPTVRKRYMGGHYNVNTHSYEEGMYISALKFLGRIFVTEDVDKSYTITERIKASLESLNDVQKANCKKSLTEFSFLTLLALLITYGLGDWDDDDDYITRSMNFYARRLKQEIEFYQPWNINSIYDILQSPSATLGMFERVGRVVRDIPDIHVLETGPYKGELNIVAHAKRALPVYPQIRDMIYFTEEDTRFKQFQN